MYEFILVYVDDLLIFASTQKVLSEILSSLKGLYELRVSEGVNLFLGVQLYWSKPDGGSCTSVRLSQQLYCESILRRFGMQNSKPALTPMVEAFFTGYAAEEDKSPVNPELYRQMIGSLLYLALRTRFDILAAVLILARFQKEPTFRRNPLHIVSVLQNVSCDTFAAPLVMDSRFLKDLLVPVAMLMQTTPPTLRTENRCLDTL